MTARRLDRARTARFTLSARVVALVVLLALIGFASVVANVLRDRQQLLAQSFDRTRHTAQNVAHDIDRAVADGLTYAGLLSADPSVMRRDAAECEALAARLASIDPAYPAFSVSDPDGVPWCRYPANGVAVGFADADWFGIVVETGTPSVSGFSIGRISGVSVLQAAVPVVREGRVVGVATTGWVTRALADHREIRDLAPGSHVWILDHDGVVVMTDSTGTAFGERLAQGSGALEALEALDSDDPRPVLDDGHVYVAAVAEHASVVVQTPSAAVFGPAARWAWRSLSQGAATLAIGLLLLLLALDRWILRPVTKMNETVFRIAAGDLRARTGLSRRGDELGLLAAALDAMAAELGVQRAATDTLTTQLAERSEQLRMLMEHSPSLVMILDRSGRMRAVSHRAAAVMRRPVDDIVGRRFDEVLPEALAAEVEARLQEVRRGNHVRTDDRLEVGGVERIYHTELFPIFDAEGGVVAIGGMATDVTDERRHAAELERVAATDPLTGLANRRAFTSHVDRVLARAVRRGHLVAIGYLDLDGFKEVNDTFGHATGDAVLAEVGRRLDAATRAGEVVARLGGDEFTLCLERVDDLDEVRAAATRVLGVFAEPFGAGAAQARLTASMGVAVAPGSGRDAETLLRSADRAMYAAKLSGIREVVFAP